MNRLIILDRDGVINADSPHYIKSAEEFVFLPGSIEAIAQLTQAGYSIAVATNQSGLARGYYTEEGLQSIHEKMLTHIRRAGGDIKAILYCNHLPEAGCSCRKPEPGMLYSLAERFDVTLEMTPFVGDKLSDLQAAKASGAMPIMVLSPMTDRLSLEAYPEVPVFPSLQVYVSHLLTSSSL